MFTWQNVAHDILDERKLSIENGNYEHAEHLEIEFDMTIEKFKSATKVFTLLMDNGNEQ